MTEINSLNSLRGQHQSTTKTSTQPYYPKQTQLSQDTVELSTKEKEPQKRGIKKYVLAGLAVAGTALAVVLGLKHMNAKKALELEEKAKQEAERLRQQAEEAKRQAEEAKRQAEEKLKQEAEELKTKTEVPEETKAEIPQEAETVKEEPKAEINEEPVTEITQEPEVIKEEPKAEVKEEPTPEVKEEPAVQEEIKTETPVKEPETIKEEPKPEIKQEPKIEVKEEPEIKEPEIKEDVKVETPKTRPVRPQGLSQAMNTALDFGEDLADLVKGKNATPEEIQKLVQKHFKKDNIRIHGMSEYDGMGVNAKNKAATTRPYFNEAGELETVDIFVPDLDYNDSNAVMEFISKTTHEMTHVAQFIEKDGSNAEYLKPTMEGRFLNWIQKITTDRYTDKLPTDMIKALFQEKGIVPRTAEDVNKFFDSPNPELTLEKIGEITKLGRTAEERKQNVNIIFDVLIDPVLEQMIPKDPNVQSLLEKHGGYEGLKAEIKSICAETFRNEQEAYKAEEMMRQQLSGNVGQDTNYGLIHKIMGICADGLG